MFSITYSGDFWFFYEISVFLVFHPDIFYTVGFFEEFFVGGGFDEHELGEVAVGFVFEAGDFFSGAD